MIRRHGSSRRLVACASLLLIIPVGVVSAQDRPTSAGPIYDCGTMALYTLHHLAGRPIALRDLEAYLPPVPTHGYSMRDLRDAARRSGFDLVGVRLHQGDRAPDGPLLAYVRGGQHGHFIVVRPVGHTGKLVQVIDSNRAPEVLDAAELYAAPNWTGLALWPRRPNGAMRGVLVLSLGVALAIGLDVSLRWRPRDVGGSIAPSVPASG